MEGILGRSGVWRTGVAYSTSLPSTTSVVFG